ncbi:MAG: carbohydrate ABC transporter permease [Ardenticatenaceae bacterium]|nr:carbohydrate ABC transporter permease [Anaerolineales bacterium]MCB8982689.1 carbohydrate ABC transporter permease [Ardenticatenaceae bacterium]
MTTISESIPQSNVNGRVSWATVKKVLSYGILFLLALTFIYPFLLAIATSFKTLPEINQNPVSLIPQVVTLEGYQRLLTFNVPRWTLNSALVAVSITLGNLLFASLGGYALARIRFPGSKAVFLGILGTMMIPGIVLLIPMFIVLKALGFVDTYAGLIMPKLITAFSIFLMKQFFESVPRELEEAARIDGASPLQIFFRVVLPTAKPALVALIIFSFQGAWNDFMHPLIVITVNQQLFTLPLGLALLRGGMGQNLQWNSLMAGSMLTTLPMAIVFFVFQRYFIEGISYSGIKG